LLTDEYETSERHCFTVYSGILLRKTVPRATTLYRQELQPVYYRTALGELCCSSLTAKLACDRLRRLVIDMHTFIWYLSVIKTTYYNVLFAAVSSGSAWYYSCAFTCPFRCWY